MESVEHLLEVVWWGRSQALQDGAGAAVPGREVSTYGADRTLQQGSMQGSAYTFAFQCSLYVSQGTIMSVPGYRSTLPGRFGQVSLCACLVGESASCLQFKPVEWSPCKPQCGTPKWVRAGIKVREQVPVTTHSSCKPHIERVECRLPSVASPHKVSPALLQLKLHPVASAASQMAPKGQNIQFHTENCF